MVLSATRASAVELHLAQSVMAFVQPHPMSLAKLVLLVALVVFFTGLLICSYIWMRRPNFGQKNGPVPGTVEIQDVEKSGKSLSD
jgi:hypothetical protein